MNNQQPNRAQFIMKLSSVQANAKAGKNQNNDFGGYAYRNCEDILESLKPHLDGLAVVINDEIIESGGRVYIKATVTVTDGVNEISNCAYAREADAKKGMDVSQITGAASSYARKYALSGMFMIDNNKDADSMDNREQLQQNNRRPINQRQQPVQQPVQQQQQQQQQPTQRQQYYQTVAQDVREQRQQRTATSKVEKVIGPGQFKLLKEAISMSGMTLEQFNRVCHLSQLGELPACKFKGAMNWLKEKAQAA